MKKILIGSVLVLLALGITGVIVGAMMLDRGVKRGVEHFGPIAAKVPITVGAVKISILSGQGAIEGLVVGNPEGYKGPEALTVARATLGLRPSSLLSDKLVITTLRLEAPEVNFEGGLKGNNLSRILANLEQFIAGATGTGGTPSESAPAKKLQVDEFVITGARAKLALTELGGRGATVSIPEIRLAGLGAGPEGITPAELARRAMTEVVSGATKAAVGSIADLGKGAVDAAKNLGQGAVDAAKDVTQGAGNAVKGIGNLFKKK